MRRNVKHNGHRAKRLVGQLAAEKKKVVMALCLISVMALMWIRVLTKKAPEADRRIRNYTCLLSSYLRSPDAMT